VSGLIQDFRYGARVCIKSSAYTLVAVITLAIGIAANTTVFSWIDAILLRPIPGASNSQALVAFETLTPDRDFITTSYADYRDYRDHATLLAGLAIAQPRAFSAGEAEHSEHVWGELVSGDYFDVLGVHPVAGRIFAPAEYGDEQSGHPVAVIGYSLWQRRYNGDPSVIGRTLRINGRQLTIVGVAPREFRGAIAGLAFELWVPATMGPQLNLMPDWMLRDRKTRSFMAVARLKPGVTLNQASAEIRAIAERLARMYPQTNEGMSATVLPLWQSHFGAQSLLRGPLRILMAVGAVVLLIVCANVANLLLARSAARRREFSVRLALGAGRLRIVRQLLVESLLLAGAGSLVAVPLALWMSLSLGYLAPPGSFPVVFETQMNARILAFAIFVAAIACVASAISPALESMRVGLTDALNEGGRSGTAGRRSSRMRAALVVSEVALALVAIIGAGLFAKSFETARRMDPGFDPKHVLASHLYLSSVGYTVPERKQFCRRLRERLESLPGVIAAAYADVIPLGFERSWEDLRIDGYAPRANENMKIYRNVVAPGYFDLMRIPIVDGRDFTEHDDENSNPVMIVSETFARRFFAGRNPIGYRVQGWGRWFTIVGIAKDSKYDRPNEAPQPYFYVPFRQVYREDIAIALLVRVAGDPRQAISSIRREVRAMDPNVDLFDAMPLTEYIGAAVLPQKVAASLLGVLGFIALAFAAAGLYSVMAYSIAQRVQEIGIRMALGARPGDVLALVVRQGMTLAVIGVGLGAIASFAVTRVAASLLVNVSATDPLVFAGAAIFLAAVALISTYVPARRATGIDPAAALRSQ
jgi:predicted permease